MQKNTIIAVALSVVVLVGFYVVQGIFFPKKPAAGRTTEITTEQTQRPTAEQPASQQTAGTETSQSAIPTSPVPAAPVSGEIYALPDSTLQYKEYTIKTDMITVILSNAGGDIISWKLNNHGEEKESIDNDSNSKKRAKEKEPIEMIRSLKGNVPAHAFTVTFDNIENALDGRGSAPESGLFNSERTGDYSVVFSKDFIIPGANGAGNSGFKLTKRYTFKPNEYMFELVIALERNDSAGGFNFNGAAYTLAFGPQIGPRFEKLDQRTEYRQYLTYNNKKVKQEKLNVINKDLPPWAAIAGKYFALIAIPQLQYSAPQYQIAFSDRKERDSSKEASRLFISRSDLNNRNLEDRYLFYLGPKNTDNLNIYYNGKNSFGLNGSQIVEAAKTRSFLSIPPLEKGLKWLLVMFHKLIPNYGIAIILLTLLVKILFFPLTRKSSEATQRMQKLSPKIKELQAKYKDNPQKMNAEMAELYKKEGYNPLSGCLPMLLQIPIFFAMYNLFNNHFDLRGAMFIPGWIPDLSVPEFVWIFPDGYKLPLLGWTALRLLPFIYVGSQLIYGKVTQTPDQQGNKQMKMMLFVMPIVFFFILYDVPSGLLIYWIFSNLLTLVQQVIINKVIMPRKAEAGDAEPVIAPKKKKKKGYF